MKTISSIKSSLHFCIVTYVAILLTGCMSIARYDQFSYQQATSLKVDAVNLVGKGTEPYSTHESKIADLMTRVEKAHEYDKNRFKNEESTQMWILVKDPNKDLLGGFIAYWKSNNQLNVELVQEKQKQIGKAFDKIIGLESGKNK